MRLRPALIAVAVTALLLLQLSPGWAQQPINYAWDPARTAGGVWDFNAPNSDFLPSRLSGLQLWLRASSIASCNGAAIATWSDESGNGNNATQATGANQPTCQTNIVNGKPVVRFDGSNDYLTGSTTALNFERTDSFAIFIVALKNGTTENQIAFSKELDTGTSRGYYVNYQSSNGGNNFQVQLILINDASVTPRISIDKRYASALQIGIFNLLSVTYNGSSLAAGYDLYVNGTLLSTTPTTDNLTDTIQSTAPINIGARNNAASFFNGDIAEIIIYNPALSAADRQRVERYLRDEYQVSAPTLSVNRFATPVGTITVSSGSRTPSLYWVPESRPTTQRFFSSGQAFWFDGVDDYVTSVITNRSADTDTLNHLVDSGAAVDFTDNIEVGDEAVDTTNGDKCLVTAVADTDLTLDGDCFAAGTENYRVQSGGLSPTAALTLEAVIRMDQSGVMQDIASKQGAWRFGADSSDRLFLEVYDSTNAVTAVSGPTLTTGQRYDVAGSFDGSTLRLHVDGAPPTTATLSATLRDSVSPFIIGSLDGAQAFFQGIIDDVWLSGTAESQAEIRSRHMKRKARHVYAAGVVR